MKNMRHPNSFSLRHKWAALAFICLIFCPLHSMAKVVHTRVVKGIIEETVKSDIGGFIMYHYTTRETKAAAKALVRKTKFTGDSLADRRVPQNPEFLKAKKDFEAYLYRGFFDNPNVRNRLKRGVAIKVYSTDDGKVILSEIRCREELLDLLGAGNIKRLIDLVQAYRFEPFRPKGNYRKEWLAKIDMNKKRATEEPLMPPFMPKESEKSRFQ